MSKIYCCGCQKVVVARRTSGEEIYPHRPDLYKKIIWKCDECKNYIGSHADGKPLGTIPTKDLMRKRQRLHFELDRKWKHLKKMQHRKNKRSSLYKKLSNLFGREFHIGSVSNMSEYNRALKYIKQIR